MTDPGEDQSLYREEVAYLAYLIWEEEGRPAGREKTHWREAEAQWNADEMLINNG